MYPCDTPLETSNYNFNASFPNTINGNFSFPQLDGNATLTDIRDPFLTPPSPDVPPHRIALPTAGTNSKQAGFSLNKKKQLQKLNNDAKLADFTITVSPSNQNVNIQCSTGFYTHVAIPALRNLKIGEDSLESGINVYCFDIIGKIDAIGSAINTVLHFRLKQDKVCIGGVTIHLHHTTRLVQVQGSAILPDQSYAPVWFVENFIKERFSHLSTTKSQEVASFNNAVQVMVTKFLKRVDTQNKCSGCNLQFGGRSVPEFCKDCSNYYHKFKCFPSKTHPCFMKKRSRSCSILPQSQAGVSDLILSTPTLSSSGIGNVSPHPQETQQQQQPNTTLGSSPGHQVGTVFRISTSPSQQTTLTSPSPAPSRATPSSDSSTAPPAPQHQQPLNSSPGSHPGHQLGPKSGMPSRRPQQLIPTLPQSSYQAPDQAHMSAPSNSSDLDPSAPPFESRSSQPSTANQPTAKNKKKTKQAPATDQQGLDLEYARYEVNTTKAKLRDQENTINDLKFRNGILQSRI